MGFSCRALPWHFGCRSGISAGLASSALHRLCFRSGIPVATAVLAVAVENKVPTRAEFTSLLVLTAGVMIAVWEGTKGSMRGICFASLGMLSNAVRHKQY